MNTESRPTPNGASGDRLEEYGAGGGDGEVFIATTPHAYRPGLTPRRMIKTLAPLVILLSVMGTLFLVLGYGEVSLLDALHDAGSLDRTIILRLRLPRLLTAITLGGTLAISGGALQAVLRNPLADPYILGVSGGAAVGGSLAMALGVSALATLPLLWITLSITASFAGACLAAFLTLKMATIAGKVHVYHALLVGVVINSFSAAVVTFLKSTLEAQRAHDILLWLMGTLAVESVPTGILIGCLALATLASTVLLCLSRPLNLLALGADEAMRLGIHSDRLAKMVLLATSAAVGASVALAGMIGFVGLVVPHALRLWIGPDHRLLLPASGLAGAILLIGCDLVGRMAFPLLATEVPVGALTAFLGGPTFLYMLKKGTLGSSQKGLSAHG